MLSFTCVTIEQSAKGNARMGCADPLLPFLIGYLVIAAKSASHESAIPSACPFWLGDRRMRFAAL
jgi:hypothetical protein